MIILLKSLKNILIKYSCYSASVLWYFICIGNILHDSYGTCFYHFVINSLYPERCNFKCVILQHMQMIDIVSISRSTVLRWIPKDFTDDKSTLVQVMAWCHQATSHHLSQCWPRSMSPYGISRPQRVTYYICIIIYHCWHMSYHQTSSISHTKSQHLNVSRLVLQLSLPNPLKPSVKPRVKM